MRKEQLRQRRSPCGTLSGNRVVLGSALGFLGGLALANRLLARRAERLNPPAGRFVHKNGVLLHHIDRGAGRPLVLLHGNGGMIEDLTCSGLVDLAARHYRVLAFDRPGYGHSARPGCWTWNADAQADLIVGALEQLGIDRPVVLGHSWGASVAMAMALRHPAALGGVVLVSGYYFPTARLDALSLGLPAVPVLGAVIRHTVLPVLARLAWPFALRRIFGPQRVPARFMRFPREMALRPSQLRASAEESALLLPDAMAASGRYSTIALPVAIVAGTKDQLINHKAQSARLHRLITQSTYRPVPGAGHMVHYTNPEVILAAIEDVQGAIA